ncbi:MAG: P1 family peptidase [Peptostreptococcaceae bacterium]|nr:P1 family peptidase [Peptostreptococcaceae bacterium]MDY5739038.1 P1 family peptidase [Anaerovoracaceae bacterium]
METNINNAISINSIEGFKIGSAEDGLGGTGVTAIISENGAVAGVDVRGGGPATRETDLLKPENMVQEIHAVVLSGGSAYGLESSSGVMEYLENQGIGFDVGVCKVPIVCGASLFDLHVADHKARPNKEMGKLAAENAFKADKSFKSGNYGAGTGATIGKYKGPDRMMKSGIGASAVEIEGLKIGAISAVNALGDVFDLQGVQIAGLLNRDKTGLSSTYDEMTGDMAKSVNVFTGNTTISCIITNAKLTKAQCTKLASIAHDGYARAIKPVHTTADGDTIFVLAAGEVEVNFDALAAAATDQIHRAIIDGVISSEDAYGVISAKSLI